MDHIGHQVISSVKKGLGDSQKKFVHLARLYDIWPEVMKDMQDLPALPYKIFVNTKTTPKTMRVTIRCPAALGPRLAMQKGLLMQKINFLMGEPVTTDIVFDHRL
jgi:hypothetical protein